MLDHADRTAPPTRHDLDHGDHIDQRDLSALRDIDHFIIAWGSDLPAV